jgi:hypothetical protein
VLKITEVVTSYPDYRHLDGSRDYRPSDAKTTINIIGSRWELWHHLGLGEEWVHRVNGWDEVIDYDTDPEYKPCKLKGMTVLDKLVELGVLEEWAEDAIRERLNLECEGCSC